MSARQQMLAASGVASITIPSNWGSQNGNSPQTSATKTLTVPGGNPGNLLFDIITTPSGSFQYIKNAGAPVTVTDLQVVNFANGDTLAFRLTGDADLADLLVKDNTTLASVGTCTISTN
jgi:hypothetical protein